MRAARQAGLTFSHSAAVSTRILQLLRPPQRIRAFLLPNHPPALRNEGRAHANSTRSFTSTQGYTFMLAANRAVHLFSKRVKNVIYFA